MPISVHCSCGQNFSARDDLRGQTLLCPKCHQPLTIGAADSPQPSAATGGIDELYDEVGLKAVQGRRCPSCGAGIPDRGVLCLECGFNTTTGTKVTGANVRQRSAAKGVAEFRLEKAKEQIATDQVEERKNRSQGAPAWFYFFALAVVIAFSTTMYLRPRDEAFRITGATMIGLPVLVQVIYLIRLVIVAFMESLKCGLLYLFVPFYALYYIATRWTQCGRFVVRILLAAGVQLLGAGVLYLAS